MYFILTLYIHGGKTGMRDCLNEVQTQALEEIETKKRVNPFDFSAELEDYIRREGVEYITGLLYLCDVYDFDYENVGKYLTKSIKIKIAQENGLLERIFHINSSLI